METDPSICYNSTTLQIINNYFTTTYKYTIIEALNDIDRFITSILTRIPGYVVYLTDGVSIYNTQE
jgi:hypothetical protein